MEVWVSHDALCVSIDRTVRGQTVSDVLQTALRLPRRFVLDRLAAGAVWIGNRVARGNEEVDTGKRLRLVGGVEADYGVPVAASPAHDAALDVLYEDDHLLVANKPAGVLVHPGDETDVDTMAHRVAAYYQSRGLRRRVLHVHRLDKGTTGTLLYAKHAYSARALDALLADGNIRRVYRALVLGRPELQQGTIAAPIGRDRHVSGKYRVSPTGKPAVTHYRALASCCIGASAATLVECRLETGRTHQIRVHMASIGCPVVGDELYGGGSGVGHIRWGEGHALHALRIDFLHPYDGLEVSVTAPFPTGFQQVIETLGLTPIEED